MANQSVHSRATSAMCPVCADENYRCRICGECFQCHYVERDYWWQCPSGGRWFRPAIDGSILWKDRWQRNETRGDA